MLQDYLGKSFIYSLLATLVVMTSVYSQQEAIPLTSQRQPSNDLLYKGRVLTAEEARLLLRDTSLNLDLSQLDPVPSSVWTNDIQSVLDADVDNIPVNEEEAYDFKGTIVSNQGIIRFNVIPQRNKENVFTILMEKTLHTTLLRRNLLRKLGYIVPPMKYLKKIKVTFHSVMERNHFLTKELPEATYGAPSRWLGFDHKELKDDQLTLTFHDVVGLMPSETDHYNLAMGVPPRRLTTRTLRSLLIPYALLNVGESVNKLPWTVGRVDNDNLILPHFTYANMNTTLDDTKWSLRRVALLDRLDWEEVVKEAGFPTAVEKILIEKLISRRNSLLSLLGIEHVPLNVNTEISYEEDLVKGQLTKEDWSGFASRFSHGEPDSPFKDFHFFIFSKIQNSAITNLLNKFNEKLDIFDPSEKKLEFLQDQFEKGLEDYVETGVFKEFPVGTWFSPILTGNLILSRDIVVGNYLGTDNLVQLADTIGVSVTLGGILGVENIPRWPVATATGTVNAVRTYTHLKPVKTLKATFKEPYKNMMVPLLKLKLKKKLDELANVPSLEGGIVPENGVDPRLKVIEELIGEVNSHLGVGESLLITDRLTPNLMGSGSFSMLETKFSLSAGTSGAMVRRLHLYRKDASTIQIYEDRGHGLTLSVSASISNLIPIVKLSSDRTNGKYKVKMHSVNINSDVSENPDLFSNAKALHYLLEEGSSELLEVRERPYSVEGDFDDRSVKLSFLVWRSKYLTGDNEITVVTPTKNRTEYVSLTSASQSGINYQSFTYDVLNYYLKEWTKDLPITPQLDPERYKNPGQSIFGVSETVSGRYEARKVNEKLEKPFLSLSTRREGWSASKKKLLENINELNEQYNRRLFDPRSIENSSGLNLFDISVSTNIYEEGIERLKSVKQRDIEKVSRQYSRDRSRLCGVFERRNFNIRTASQFTQCQNLKTMEDKARDCQRMRRQEGDSKDQAKCTMELAKSMVKNLEFKDFVNIVGEENIYVYGVINGFRKDSEILNEPIRSNTIGRIRGQYWNGPLDRVKEIMGIQGGEFHGKWIRESL
ncbi:MAG: hypothetical protein K9K67_10240 [Bacteriovoracaceae bacterium]|nr:hypothetical protein [Bacteriovoracaceae bacterium]